MLLIFIIIALYLIGRNQSIADNVKDEIIKPVITNSIETTGEITVHSISIVDKFGAGFIKGMSEQIDKKENKPNEDIERIKEDWAYIIGKSDKPSAKTLGTNRPSRQSQILMNRF